MSLVNMHDLLQEARKQKYAVGGFNVFNFETLGAVIEVAEELKAPLVLGFQERLFKFVDAETLSAAMLKAAHKSSVPVALHLDHGYSYEGIMKAIRWGFTSVMFDGSRLSLEENLKRTREVTRMAHAIGISVEGELAHMGSEECADGIAVESVVTPSIAATFVGKTKVDALAVAVGENHGVYKGSPDFDATRIKVLSDAVNVPLVLHGSAKMSKDDYKASIEAGVAKINIATDMSLAAAETLKGELGKNPNTNYIHLMSVVKKGVKESVWKYMLSFDCIAKVNQQHTL